LGGDDAASFDPIQSDARSLEPLVERVVAQLMTDLRQAPSAG
jgi:hypothetical protein